MPSSNLNWRSILKLKSHIPIKVDIGEDEALALGVKRLTYEEGVKLRAKWKETENAKAEEKDELWGSLLADSFRRFLRLECEIVIECADGDMEIRRAEELLEFFGGEPTILNEIFFSIIAQSGLTKLQKKVLSSVIASKRSSGEPEKDPAGQKQETTAESAGSEGSASNGDATSEVSDPSGSTDLPENQSSSTSARSVH